MARVEIPVLLVTPPPVKAEPLALAVILQLAKAGVLAPVILRPAKAEVPTLVVTTHRGEMEIPGQLACQAMPRLVTAHLPAQPE